MTAAHPVARAAPMLFVLLWSTGFIAAKYVLPYAEPFTVLFWRFVCTLVVLAGLYAVLRPAWPTWRVGLHTGVSGLLIHGCYLGGVFFAVAHGLSPALTAVIVGLQPLLTTLATPWVFGRAISPWHWLGVWLGLIGIVLILQPWSGESGIAAAPLAAVVAALLGITVGTMYQNKFSVEAPLLSTVIIQYLVACVWFGLGAWLFETGAVTLSLPLVLGMAWLVVVLSVGAILLLLYLIRLHETHTVASLFYLTPPLVALQAWALFGDTLDAMAALGIAVVAIAVYLTTQGAQASQGDAAGR